MEGYLCRVRTENIPSFRSSTSASFQNNAYLKRRHLLFKDRKDNEKESPLSG
jgi:hypothetical protein